MTPEQIAAFNRRYRAKYGDTYDTNKYGIVVSRWSKQESKKSSKSKPTLSSLVQVRG